MRPQFNSIAIAVTVLTATLMVAANANAQLLETYSKTVKDGGAPAVQGYLDAGGNPNAPDTSNRNLTLLHWAAFYGKADVVKLLLDRGAVADAPAKDPDWRPIHYAAWFGHKDAVALLLDHGAPVNGFTSDGVTPLSAAANYSATTGNYSEEGRLKKVALIPYLLSRGADGGTALVRMTRDQLPDGAKLLLDAGVSPNATPWTDALQFGYEIGGTALFVAAQNGNLDLARLLLSRGADPNVGSPKSVNMPTPLMMAAYYCDGEMIDLLLSYGAERWRTNSSGDTAAMLAESGWTTDMKACPADVTAKLS